MKICDVAPGSRVTWRQSCGCFDGGQRDKLADADLEYWSIFNVFVFLLQPRKQIVEETKATEENCIVVMTRAAFMKKVKHN